MSECFHSSFDCLMVDDPLVDAPSTPHTYLLSTCMSQYYIITYYYEVLCMAEVMLQSIF